MVRNNEPLEPSVSLLLETLESVRQSFRSDDVRETSLGGRVDRLSEESLEVGGESLVEPKVAALNRKEENKMSSRDVRRVKSRVRVEKRKTHAHDEHPMRFPNHE